jgi:hypothetical protein
MGSKRDKVIAIASLIAGALLCFSCVHFIQARTRSFESYQDKLVTQLPAGFFGGRIMWASSQGGSAAYVYRIVDGDLFLFEVRHDNRNLNETRVFIYKLNANGETERDEFGKSPLPPCVRWESFRRDGYDVHSQFKGYRKEQVDFLIRCTQELSVTAYHAFRQD